MEEDDNNQSQQKTVRWEYIIPNPDNFTEEEHASFGEKGLPITIKVWSEDLGAYHDAISQRAVDNQVQASVDRHLGSFRKVLERTLKGTQMADSRPSHLNVKQVAEAVHVTEPTVREWIKSGELKASRIGPEGKARIYCVRREDLDEFLHRRRVDPVTRDVDDQAAEILATLKKGA